MTINLRQFDLNLLKYFSVLMVERNLSKAAERMGVGQSAMSHALRRLRELFKDPILIKTEEGMSPTPFALSMEDTVQGVFNDINRNLKSSGSFIPMTNQTSFVISSTEYFESVFLPTMTKWLSVIAPGITTVIDILPSTLPTNRLNNGEIDFAVIPDLAVTEVRGLRVCPLVKDPLVFLTLKNHPTIGEQITFEQLAKERLICCSAYQSELRFKIYEISYHMDHWFESHHIKAKVVVTTQTFAPVAMIASRTGGIAILPSKVAYLLMDTFKLKIVTPPADLPKLCFNLAWHPRFDDDPAHQWFRNQLFELAKPHFF